MANECHFWNLHILHTYNSPVLYNRAHNILELVDILPNVYFTTSETEPDYYY